MSETLFNLLAEKPDVSTDGYPINWLGIGEGLIYALLGFIVTFIGIVILIFFVWLYGKIIRGVRGKLAAKRAAPVDDSAKAVAADEEIPLETKLAIIAAISAYYEGEKADCGFKVKRIKRL